MNADTAICPDGHIFYQVWGNVPESEPEPVQNAEFRVDEELVSDPVKDASGQYCVKIAPGQVAILTAPGYYPKGVPYVEGGSAVSMTPES